MDILNYIKIGHKVEVNLMNEDLSEFQEEEEKTSQVVDIKGEKIYISLPKKGAIPFRLRVMRPYYFTFITPKSGLLRVKCLVTNEIEDNILMYGIKPMSQARRIQRRDYYRLSVLKEVNLTLFEENRSHEAIITDISGGGIQVISKNEMDMDEEVSIEFLLEKDKKINAIGKIIRKSKNNVENNYEMGINFIRIDEKQRKEIVAYIFNKQRELRKKGLI